MAKEGNDDYRLVHLDLKGAPPRVNYYEQLLPLLYELGANGLLIEYEDMFPYWGDLSDLAAPECYSKEEIHRILELAKENHLLVIPLVQTFGHFEFVLKHDKFVHLREVSNFPMALCPSLEESFEVVCTMIDQVMELHDDIQWFHIGADEVFHQAICERCRARMPRENAEQIFISHVKRTAGYIKNKYNNCIPIAWDDMFRTSSIELLKESGIGDFIEPMVWEYSKVLCLPSDIWLRYSQCFKSVWFASAFKGATGSSMYITDCGYHIENHLAWLQVIKSESQKFGTFRGTAITGWQRYDHYAVLCELLPVGIPTLALCLQTLVNECFTEAVHHEVSSLLGFKQLIPYNPFLRAPPPEACNFPGSDIFLAMQMLLRLNADFEEFIKDESLNSWMTSYHIKHKYTNPVHLQQFLPRGLRIIESFKMMLNNLEQSLPKIFYPSMVEEWLEVNIVPKLKQTTEITENAQKLIAVGAKPKMSESDNIDKS